MIVVSLWALIATSPPCTRCGAPIWMHKNGLEGRGPALLCPVPKKYGTQYGTETQPSAIQRP